MLSSGRFTGVCSLSADVSEHSVCSIFIGVWVWRMVLQNNVIIKAMFFTQFKICCKYEFIWWVWPPSRHYHRRFWCSNIGGEGRKKGGGAVLRRPYNWVIWQPAKTYNKIKRKFRLWELWEKYSIPNIFGELFCNLTELYLCSLPKH
jgi:hypothetical protein